MLDQIKIDILDGIAKIIDDKDVKSDYKEFLKFVYNYMDNNIKRRYSYNTNEYIGILKSLNFDKLFTHYINIVNEFKTIYPCEVCWKEYEEDHIFYEIPESKLEYFTTHYDETISSEDTYFTICYNKYVFYNKTTVKEEMLNKLVFWLNVDEGLRSWNDSRKMHIVRDYIDKNLLHKK